MYYVLEAVKVNQRQKHRRVYTTTTDNNSISIIKLNRP